MQLQEIKNIYHKELDPLYQKEEVDSFFYLLLEHFLGLERFILALQPNYTLGKDQEQPLFEALSRLKLNHPIQYILGKVQFMDVELAVNRHVLIPRPETEGLVRWVIEDFNHNSLNINVLDIGTGSGCIAVSLAKHLPISRIFALDISEEALRVAHQNVESNGVRVTLMNHDIFEWEGNGVLFDAIISNPPYVRESEQHTMHKNVLDHEPATALFVPDQNPLKFYRAIAHFAMANLKVGGGLYFEINQYLANDMCALLRDFAFDKVELRKDIFDNYRMIKCIKNIDAVLDTNLI